MANKLPYAYWYGDPLTEFQYLLYEQAIIQDSIIEEYIGHDRLGDAQDLIDYIKRKINEQDQQKPGP